MCETLRESHEEVGEEPAKGAGHVVERMEVVRLTKRADDAWSGG